jgi:hypothetical protein
MNWRVAGRVNPDQPVFNMRETILSKFSLPPCMEDERMTERSEKVRIVDPTQI